MFISRNLLFVGLFFGVLAACQFAVGQDRDWGGSSGDWNVAANWLQNDVPNTAGETAILGGGGYNVNYDFVTTIGGLSFSSSSTSLTFNPSVSSSFLGVNSDFSIGGTLNLNSNVDGLDVTLLRAGTITNSAAGTVNFGGNSTAATTDRQLQANLFVNDGTVNVNQNGLFNRTSGVFTNNSGFNIATGRTFGFGAGNTFNQNAGTVSSLGTFGFSGDILNFNGGNFTGNAVELVSSTLNIGVGSVGTGTFDMSGTGSYSGDLAVAQTANIKSLSTVSSFTTATADFTNNGSFNLSSDFDDKDVTLLRAGTVTNSTTGTVNFGGTSTATNTLRQLQTTLFVNDGTVNINRNGLFNRTSGVFTNNQDVNIASGASLTFGAGNSFNQNAGAVNNLGEMVLVGDILNYNGGNFTGNAVELVNSTLNIGTGSVGTGTFNMTGTGSYSGDLAAAQTVNIKALSTGNSFTTATANFVNNGTFNLDSDFDGRDVTLLRAGTITNSASGIINFDGTSTAATTDRQLQASLFVNDGTVNVNKNGLFNRTSGVFTNNLGVNIASGASLTFGAGNSFNQNAGTVNNLGEVVLVGDILNYNGGNFTGNAVELVGSTLNVGTGSVGTGTFNMTGSGSYSGDLASIQTVNIRALSTGDSFTTTTANFTNHGKFNLISDFDGKDVTLLRAGTITNSASGIIDFDGSSTAATTDRQLQASLFVNDGTVNVNRNGLFNRTSGVFTNNLDVNIASSATLTFGAGNSFNQNAGSVNNLGGMVLVGDILNYNGGNFTGNAVELVSSTLNIGAGSVDTGTFNMTGTGSYSGDLAANQTVNIRALSTGNSFTTTTANFTNHGTFNLISDFDGRDVTLLRAGTITNSASGIISFGGNSIASTTDRQLQASLFVNNGTVNVNRNGLFNRTSGVFTNNLDVNIAAGTTLAFGAGNTFNQNGGLVSSAGTMNLLGDILNFNGGDFAGNAVELVSSTLKIGVGSVGTGTFNMTGVGAHSGDLAAAQTVNILAISTSSSATTATANFTNNGTINLISDFDTRDVTLFRTGTIINSASGIITFDGTSILGTTDRYLNAELLNAGLVDVIVQSTATKIGASGDNHLNSGTIISRDAASIVTVLGSSFTNLAGGTLAGLGELDFTQTSLTNNGIIDPGLSAGMLTLDGNVVFGSTADLQIELGGLTQGIDYDFLNGLDNLTLNGDLSVTFIGGFQNLVDSGDSFTILSSAGLSGNFFGLADGATFATDDGYGFFQINYVGNNVVLSNFSAIPEPGACLGMLVVAVLCLFQRPQRSH